jgi:hypothetical protein
MRSIDWSKPVERIELKAGEHVDIWVRDGGVPGAYGTTPGTKSGLGMETAGRHVERFELQEPMVVLRTTAADFPSGLYPGVGGPGGATQFVLPENFLGGARRIP